MSDINANGLSEAELLRLLMKGASSTPSMATIRRALDTDAAFLASEEIVQARETIEIARLLTEKLAARKIQGRTVLNSPHAVRGFLVARLGSARREEIGCLYLDSSFAIIRYEPIAIGSTSEVSCHPREIVRRCIELDAESVVLVHCHPSANPAISEADIVLTEVISQALKTLGITLQDHFLIAGDQCISMRESEPEVF